MSSASPRQYRHGDVFLEEVPSIPKTAKKSATRPQILEMGLATGHAHRCDDNAFVMEEKGSDQLFLRVKKASALTHEEHARIDIPRGSYRIVRQREYTPQGIVTVLD